MLKKRKRNQNQQRSKGSTLPRQLGICHRYAKLAGSDERFASVYKEIDIEIRSFISYDQDGQSNGRYFRLLENTFVLNTFEKVGEADKAFFSAVDSKINDGWMKIKGNEFREIIA
jgi:hypothetical protein